MKLRSITLTDVRRFAGTTARLEGLGDGVSIVTAPNEAGKSTAFEALEALFTLPARSTGAQARALRPYAGGAPEVTAEVEIDGARYTIAKRWLSRPFARVTELPSGRVVAQDDAAERWIADRTGGGDAGLAGLLWVRQGQRALEPEGRSATEKAEQERLLALRRELVSTVAREVDAVTGGRRMDAIADRCAAELAELATAGGKPRAGGPWKAAEDEARALGDEHDRLDGLCRELAEALEARAGVEAELAAVSDPAAAHARAQEQAAARAALDAARQRASERAAADNELRCVAAEQTSAKAALDEHDRTTARLRQAEESHRAATLRHADALAKLPTAARAESEASAAAEAARKAHAAARTARAVADQAAHARSAAARLTALDAALARAAALRDAALAADTQASGITATQGDLAAAEIAAAALDRARARLDAGAVTLKFAYLPDAPGPVTADGRAIADGTLVAITGPTVLDLPGLGRLSLAPGGDAAAAAADVEAASAELAAALAPSGAADLPALRAALDCRTEALQRARTARAELAGLAPAGLSALQAEADALRSAATEMSADALDPADARTAEDAARTRDAEAQATLANARSARAAAARDEDAAREAAEAAARAFDAAAAEAARLPARAALAQALDTLTVAARDAAARAAALADDGDAVERAEAALRDADAAVRQADERRNALQRSLAELNGLIRARSEDGVEERRDEVAGRLQEAEARAARWATEARALARLRSALAEARANARDRYLAPVTAELAPLVEMLLGGAELRLHPARLLPETLVRAGGEEPLAALSGGTQEQIAILTRLAFARLLARSGRPLPVILDDPLVFADEARAAAMRDALEAVGADIQIIVLTCRAQPFADLRAVRPALSAGRGAATSIADPDWPVALEEPMSMASGR
jgi:hypothetical protein